MQKSLIPLLFCLILFTISSAQAYETDQYTVPPEDLADMGEDLSQYIRKKIQQGLEEINQALKTLPRQIQEQENEIQYFTQQMQSQNTSDSETKTGLDFQKRQLETLKKKYLSLQTEEGLTEYLHSLFSAQITWQDQRDGIFGAPLSMWSYPQNLKNQKHILYRAGKTDIVYAFSGFHRIISPTYFVFASTLKVYNTYMGVDKIGHFFNQGFEYYSLYKKNLNLNLSPEDSQKKVIEWGISTEDGIFGKVVDGVYSNADLAANFAGFKFFLNFFEDIRVGSNHFPPLLIRHNDGSIDWNDIDKITFDRFLRALMSTHLDESLNASVLEAPQRPIVRTAIANRCLSWLKFYNLQTQEQVLNLTRPLKTWFGEDYGYKDEGTLQISDICFSPDLTERTSAP